MVKRGLAAAGIPSWLKPVGLNRGDGRRPDRITVFPYSQSKCLCWDATCVNSLSTTAVIELTNESGSAAHSAERRKREKYSGLSERYNFEPLAVETMWVIGPSSRKFLVNLVRHIAATTGEHQWLLQRISLATARGNTAAILATGSNL